MRLVEPVSHPKVQVDELAENVARDSPKSNLANLPTRLALASRYRI
jgi:hypothetical protein